jgi:hypothetical protein
MYAVRIADDPWDDRCRVEPARIERVRSTGPSFGAGGDHNGHSAGYLGRRSARYVAGFPARAPMEVHEHQQALFGPQSAHEIGWQLLLAQHAAQLLGHRIHDICSFPGDEHWRSSVPVIAALHALMARSSPPRKGCLLA